MTYIHLRSLLRRGSQLPLANHFEGEGQIPLLQPFTCGSLSYKFSKRKREVNTQAIENKNLLKALLRLLSQSLASQRLFSLLRIEGYLYAPRRFKFGLQNLNSLGFPRLAVPPPVSGGATACQCLTLTVDWRCHRPVKRFHRPV